MDCNTSSFIPLDFDWIYDIIEMMKKINLYTLGFWLIISLFFFGIYQLFLHYPDIANIIFVDPQIPSPD